jgi:8-oxo-dGTP diphosphatase
MTVAERVHRVLLGIYGRLPERWQLRVVHAVAPSHSVGALALVRDDASGLLLVRHSYKAGWGLPGGLVKSGEHPADAVVREAGEEVGLVIEVTGEPAVVVDAPTRRVDVVFRARVRPGTDAVGRPRSVEIVEVAWHPVDRLPPLQPEVVAALAAVQRLEAERAR